MTSSIWPLSLTSRLAPTSTILALHLAYPFLNSTATLRSEAVSAYVRYHFNDRFSVHGGIRLQHMSGTSRFRYLETTRSMRDSDLGVGYSVGVAYEIPDIALAGGADL